MKQKNNIKAVRRLLGLSQADFAAAIDVSQGNVSHYEGQRQGVPSEVATRIISVANIRGVTITFNDIYGS